MSTRPIVFAPARQSATSDPTYSLLTLPASLAALLADPATAHSLEIRGHTTDAAVLVSPTKTYALRGVQNSNSLCLCSSAQGEGASEGGGRGWFDGEDEERETVRKDRAIEIETVLHETLEVVQAVARTERLEGLLKGSEYRGEDAEADAARLPPVRHQTPNTLRSLLPASDAEITVALRQHRVITLNGQLRPLPPSYLLTILPSLLSSLAPPIAEGEEDESMPYAQAKEVAKPAFGKKDKKKKAAAVAEAPVVEQKAVVVEAELDDLLSALDAVDCGDEAARGVLGWFGEEQKGGKWSMRIGEMVRETGVGLLEQGGYGPQRLDAFTTKWKQLCSGFAPLCTLSLLANTALTTTSIPPSITYLPPSHLSPDPSTRFTELFALKPRWKDTDMVLFLDDLVGGDKKKRDAMVLKFVRKFKENDGSMSWTARNLW